MFRSSTHRQWRGQPLLLIAFVLTLFMSAGISATHAAVQYPISTRGGNAGPIGAPVQQITIPFVDDFETSKGWTVNPYGTDTATIGKWERNIPQPTSDTGPKQLLANSGSYDLVTGRLAGSSVGAYDVDGGTTSVRSPLLWLPNNSNPVLTFNYYLAHANNATPSDFFRIKIVSSSGTTTVYQHLGGGYNLDGAWQYDYVDLLAYQGQNIRILIEASDSGSVSLIEAAVDDLSVQSH